VPLSNTLPEIAFGNRVDAIVHNAPPVEIEDALFALVPLDPSPVDVDGKLEETVSDGLKIVKAGLGDSKGLGTARLFEGRVAVESKSDTSGLDIEVFN
jgi:hypothetical protein